MGILDNIKSSLGMKGMNSKKSKGQTLGGGPSVSNVSAFSDHKSSGTGQLQQKFT
jgi:hypothetical protein